jgi:hypothetical protein
MLQKIRYEGFAGCEVNEEVLAYAICIDSKSLVMTLGMLMLMGVIIIL